MASQKRFTHVHLRVGLTCLTTQAGIAIAVALALGIDGGYTSGLPIADAAIGLCAEGDSHSADEPWAQEKPARHPREHGRNVGEEETLRIGVTAPDGVFLVYDAVLPPESPEASAGYLAYWRDFESGRVYVYGRLLVEWVDVGHALLNLQADLQIDAASIASMSQLLEDAVGGAQGEEEDPSLWRVATRGTLLEIMGLNEGMQDGGAADVKDSDAEADLLEPCYMMMKTAPPANPPPAASPKSLGEMTETVAWALPCGPVDPPPGPPRNCPGDKDCDGIPNGSDPDVDGDGIPNGQDPDVDGDGQANGSDRDVDGDGLLNGNDPDVDGDGLLNRDDPDVDGDFHSNGEDPDVDGDGLSNGNDPDVDGDGVLNGSDDDVNGDGVLNGNDGDVDGDGIRNPQDDDVDGDGLPNESDPDDDGDSIPDQQDDEPRGCDQDCAGACCATTTGVCVLKKEAQCTAPDEHFQGKETACSPNPCCRYEPNSPFIPSDAAIQLVSVPDCCNFAGSPCLWGCAGRVPFESQHITISARCTGSKWYAVLSAINGRWCTDARLLPCVQEVTGPGGNTTDANACTQVVALDTLETRCCPNSHWFMLGAVVAHENVHAPHVEPALEAVASSIEAEIEYLSVAHAPGKTAAQAVAEIRALPAFALALAYASGRWRDELNVLASVDHEPGGPCDQAEHAVVDPMIAAICDHANAECWAYCTTCPPRPTGACCFSNGTCSVKTRCDCQGLGADYRGDGSNCGSPNPCKGACCGPAPEYTCTLLSQSQCTQTYKGDGTVCEPNPCPPWGDADNDEEHLGNPETDVPGPEDLQLGTIGGKTP